MKRKSIFVVITFVISLMMLILISEMIVRITKVSYNFIGVRNQLEYEKSAYCWNIIAAKQKLVDSYSVGQYHINSKGYRGRDFDLNKPDGKIRIVFYGGSTVFDVNAKENQDWPNLVEQKLIDKGFSNVEVINAGVPAHNSIESVSRLFTEGHLWKPDYIVLSNTYNDLKYFHVDEPILRWRKPYDPSRDPRIDQRSKLDRFLLKTSHLYGFMRYLCARFTLGTNIEVDQSWHEYYSKITPQALSQFELNMKVFVDISRDIGAVPILLTQPRALTRNSLKSDSIMSTKYAYKIKPEYFSNWIKGFEAADEIIRKVAREKDVVLIDASKNMTGVEILFTDRIHLTNYGSRIIAEIVAANLVEIIDSKKKN